MKLTIHSRTHVGQVRERNEDAFVIWTPGGSVEDRAFLAVADGMGGHPGGEIASRIAVEAAAEVAAAREADADALGLLREVFDAAAFRIRSRGLHEPRYREMGTTLTCVYVRAGHAFVGHIGDSRLYWFRGGRWTRVTADHTMAQDLVDSGRLQPEDADEHPTSHVLTRCLGVCPRQSPDLLHGSLCLKDGDTLLLATDGLGKTVHDETLAEMVGQVGTEQAADWMIEAALAAGGPDNVTVILARAIGDADTEGGAPPAHDLEGERFRLTWEQQGTRDRR